MSTTKDQKSRFVLRKILYTHEILTAENMSHILVYEINGLARPEHHFWQVVNLKKVAGIG